MYCYDECTIQPALNCEDYPVVAYLLNLKSLDDVFQTVEFFFKPNETNLVLGREEGLIENWKYTYSVTTVNVIGNTSTILDGRLFCTLIVNTYQSLEIFCIKIILLLLYRCL